MNYAHLLRHPLRVGLVGIGLAGPTWAASSECDAVLTGDLMNRVVSSSSAQSSTRQAWLSVMLSVSEDEAYDLYSREYDAMKKQGQSGRAEGHAGIYGGSVSLKLNYEQRMSRSEFGQSWRKARSERQQSAQGSNDSSSSIASTYASTVRDQGSIEAWKACMTREKSGLFAFGSRDASGTPFVNVVWAPGPFAGTAPSIPVELLANSVDTRLEVARAEIGVGSGRSFRIVSGDSKRSFSVQVNGTLQRAGQSGSFTAFAVVPAVEEASAAPVLRLMGKWRNTNAGPNACLLVVARDDGRQFNANCDMEGHQHIFSGRYVAPDRIRFEVERIDPRACSTRSFGELTFVSADELRLDHAPYDGCGVKTTQMKARLVRVE
jgi:hypothetical protein